MLYSKLEGVIIPTLVLAGLSAANIIPSIILTHPIISIPKTTSTPHPVSTPVSTSLAAPLSVPTPGQVFGNTTSASHALGGTTIPVEATRTFEPLIWTNVVVLNMTTPVGPPPAGSDANTTHIIPRDDETLVERDDFLQERSLPASVDWRNRGGLNWLTSVQNQGGCGSCWVFSAVALMETMVRIQHSMWSKRGEGDMHDQMGVSCGQGGGPDFALNWAANIGGGVADKQCEEYDGDDKPFFPCGDRSGRTLRVPKYTSLGNVQDQKQWLVNVGPISACFNVYDDFFSWDWSKPSYPYKYDGKSALAGGHCILIVGYDDTISAWIFRNSWGWWWGNSGYGTMAYGTAQIDSWVKYGMTNVNPDPWTRKRHHNGMMYQSGNGATHRNFEMVRANPAGGLTQVYRGGEAPFTWATAGVLVIKDGNGHPVTGQYVQGQPSMLGSSFNRDFEVVYWGDHGTLNHWYFSETRPGWYFTGALSSWNEFAGYPGFVQTDDSNFAIVIRNTDGSLWEWQRNNHNGYFQFERVVAPAGKILQSGPALVQSNVGLNLDDPATAGNLYVVAVLETGQMQMFWRASGPSAANTSWIPSEVFGSGIGNTPPVMVQDYWRTKDETTPGGFQLLIAVNGQVQHWQRVNTNIVANPPVAGGPGPWGHVLTFGTNIKNVWSLIHGSFSQSLEAIVEDTSGNLWHWQYTYAGWIKVAKVPGP